MFIEDEHEASVLVRYKPDHCVWVGFLRGKRVTLRVQSALNLFEERVKTLIRRAKNSSC